MLCILLPWISHSSSDFFLFEARLVEPAWELHWMPGFGRLPRGDLSGTGSGTGWISRDPLWPWHFLLFLVKQLTFVCSRPEAKKPNRNPILSNENPFFCWFLRPNLAISILHRHRLKIMAHDYIVYTGKSWWWYAWNVVKRCLKYGYLDPPFVTRIKKSKTNRNHVVQCIPILMGIWRSRDVAQKMIWERQIMHIPFKKCVLRYLRCSVSMCTVNIRDRCCKMEIGSHKFGISWLYLGVPCVVVWCRLNLIGKGTLDQIGDFQRLAYVLLGNTCVYYVHV